MTPLVKAVAALPEKQIVLMVKFLITDQVKELLSSLKHTKVDPEEINKILNLDVVKFLPDDAKKEISEMCERALKLIKARS